MKDLWPSNEAIERKLFEPSDQLVKDWAEDPSRLHKDLVQQLEDNELAIQKKTAYLAAKAEGGLEQLEDDAIEVLKMPAELASLITRRQATAAANFSSDPKPGQIRLIEQLSGTEGPIGADLASPMAVLLFEPTDEPDVWYGYAVSAETDYASYWDLVLEAETDAPFDPMAGMIQVWNPVFVYLPSLTARVLAQLSTERLEAFSSLVQEYLFGEETDSSDAQPGQLSLRWLDGHRLLTGTPVGNETDPRMRYQELYHASFEAVREIARELLYSWQHEEEQAPVEVPEQIIGIDKIVAGIDRIVAEIAQTLAELLLPFTHSPALVYRMSSSDAREHIYNLAGRIEMKLLPRLVEGKNLVEVRLELVDNKSYRVTPIKEGRPLPGRTLNPDTPDVQFTFVLESKGELQIHGSDFDVVLPITPPPP